MGDIQYLLAGAIAQAAAAQMAIDDLGAAPSLNAQAAARGAIEALKRIVASIPDNGLPQA